MFICTNDQRTYKLSHSFDSSEKCLIYVLTCNCCHKQYIGQLVDIFRNRWNNYKDNVRKFNRGENCMERHLYEHFMLPGHSSFLHNMSIKHTYNRYSPMHPWDWNLILIVGLNLTEFDLILTVSENAVW